MSIYTVSGAFELDFCSSDGIDNGCFIAKGFATLPREEFDYESLLLSYRSIASSYSSC